MPGQAARPEIGTAPAPALDERFKYKYNPKPGAFRMTPENQAKYEQSAVRMWDGFNTKPQTNLYTEDGMPNAMFGVTTLKGVMSKKDYKPPTPEEIAAGNRYKTNPNKGIYVNYAAQNR